MPHVVPGREIVVAQRPAAGRDMRPVGEIDRRRTARSGRPTAARCRRARGAPRSASAHGAAGRRSRRRPAPGNPGRTRRRRRRASSRRCRAGAVPAPGRCRPGRRRRRAPARSPTVGRDFLTDHRVRSSALGVRAPFAAMRYDAMDYVTLAPGLPPSSRLGFGCGSVMGRVGRGQSLRAIAAALDRRHHPFRRRPALRLRRGRGAARRGVARQARPRRRRQQIRPRPAARRRRAARAEADRAEAGRGACPGARPVLRSLVGGATRSRRPLFGRRRASLARPEPRRARRPTISTSCSCTIAWPDDLDRRAGRVSRRAGRRRQNPRLRRRHRHRGGRRAGRAAWRRLLYQFANSVGAPQRRPPAARRRARFIAHSPFLGARSAACAHQRRPAPG